MDEILDKVYRFADAAHGSQMRKYTPQRYIVHPNKVKDICAQYSKSLAVLSAALLHDVLEDTKVTREELLTFLQTVMDENTALATLSLVHELTDVYTKVEFPRLNRTQRKQKETDRLAAISASAQTIKYADLLDNSTDIVAHDPGFAPRFLKEALEILNRLEDGNSELRRKTMEQVKDFLTQLRQSNQI